MKTHFMKNFMQITLLIMSLIMGAPCAMAIEEAAFKVIEKNKPFEIRDYAPYIVAEVIVDGSMTSAGNRAFRVLFEYISGENESRNKITMTAPVSQEVVGEKIKMTAPVGQQAMQGKWAVSFMMPATYTMETLPKPTNLAITLRPLPTQRMAVIRYSGFWSEKNYHQHKAELVSWIISKEFVITGEPVWARYNPPFTPWFLRRNEILIPIKIGLTQNCSSKAS